MPAVNPVARMDRLGSLCITPDRARQAETELDARRADEAML